MNESFEFFIKYMLPFIGGIVLAASITPLVRYIAIKNKVYRDISNDEYDRHIHTDNVPRMGGVGLYMAFWSILILANGINRLTLGIIVGSTIILLAGVWDDLRELSAWKKFIWQLVAAGVIVVSGLSINTINNPFGGIIQLDYYVIPVIKISGTVYNFAPFADLFTIFWIVGMMNTLNFIDGLDGLATGISTIAAFVLFGLGFGVGGDFFFGSLLAIILAGITMGFLPFNFHPAKIFLGDSGAMFLGFMIGVISILSRAKVATTLLVLGFPILDLAWVALRRLVQRKSPFKPDRGHLHHRLLDAGLNQRQAVLLLYFICGAFGIASFFLKGSYEELVALILLFLMMMALSITLIIVIARRKQREANGNLNQAFGRTNPGVSATTENKEQNDTNDTPDNVLRMIRK
ncbi:MAG: undecaprenyl/decaprenyl-phosphate alpha-N-acetylglucosaminyl 1-phosphate transferase [Actinobacteria bacterium]|nr:undecaprenyl/decaprenyl-phosphate alpha-N-acetylglucosaminyl 1-phosphate transferase [Actinomycetota bacterium]